MPIAETIVIDKVRRVRRVAQRVSARVGSGALPKDAVDLVSLLFHEGLDSKLMAYGLLEDDGVLDRSIAVYEAAIMLAYEARSKVSDLEGLIAGRIAHARSMERPPIFPLKAGVASDRSRRTEVASDRAAVRILAVHLDQRALVVALSRVLLRLASDQAAAAPGRERYCHGAILMGSAKEAEADAEIDAIRRRPALRRRNAESL